MRTHRARMDVTSNHTHRRYNRQNVRSTDVRTELVFCFVKSYKTNLISCCFCLFIFYEPIIPFTKKTNSIDLKQKKNRNKVCVYMCVRELL